MKKKIESASNPYFYAFIVCVSVGIILTLIGQYYYNANITLSSYQDEDYVIHVVTSRGVAVSSLLPLGFFCDAFALLMAYGAINYHRVKDQA